jgi:hypothetical protein
VHRCARRVSPGYATEMQQMIISDNRCDTTISEIRSERDFALVVYSSAPIMSFSLTPISIMTRRVRRNGVVIFSAFLAAAHPRVRAIK